MLDEIQGYKISTIYQCTYLASYQFGLESQSFKCIDMVEKMFSCGLFLTFHSPGRGFELESLDLD